MKKKFAKKLQAETGLQDWELKVCMNIAETVPYGFDEVVYQYIATGKSFDITIKSFATAQELVIHPKDALYIVMHPKDDLQSLKDRGLHIDLNSGKIEFCDEHLTDKQSKKIVEKIIRGVDANIERNRKAFLAGYMPGKMNMRLRALGHPEFMLGGFRAGLTLPHKKLIDAITADPIKTVEQVTVEALNRLRPRNHGEWEAGRCVGGGLRYYAVHKNWEKFESYSQAEADRLIAAAKKLAADTVKALNKHGIKNRYNWYCSSPGYYRANNWGIPQKNADEMIAASVSVEPAKPANVEPRKSIKFVPEGCVSASWADAVIKHHGEKIIELQETIRNMKLDRFDGDEKWIDIVSELQQTIGKLHLERPDAKV